VNTPSTQLPGWVYAGFSVSAMVMCGDLEQLCHAKFALCHQLVVCP